MSRQEVTSSLLKPQTETKMPQKTDSYSCLRCGNKFEKPIFAVNNSAGIAEGYYACPLCLSKIESSKEEKTDDEDEEVIEEEEAVTEEEEAPSVEEEKKEIPKQDEPSPAVCPYHVGYLKKRPKNTPVPEECFTCVEMIDCMSR